MKNVIGGTLATVVTLGALVGLLFLIVFGVGACNNWSRGQKLKDARNQVKVTAIGIQNFRQKVKIAQQQADIRLANAVGIRKAQDEIQSTLTPLYVQFELVQVLEKLAASGQNNSVVFVPTSPDGGLPIIPGLTEKAGARR